MKPVAPLLPVLAVAAAVALLSVMDATMKGASLALGAYGAMLWRALVSVLLTGTLWAAGHPRRPPAPALRIHGLRGVIVAVMALLFFHSLTLLPLAQAIALSFFAPLIALYLAAALLGEQVGRRALAGSLLGFAGVIVICGPALLGGGGPRRIEGLAALFASALLYAANLVLQRRQALLAPPREIAFAQNLVTALCLLPAAPWFAGTPGAAMPLLVAAALLSAAAALLLAWGYARAEAQALVPLEYTAFIWAAAIGWLAFGERVGAATLAGVALIVAGCWIAARARPETSVA